MRGAIPSFPQYILMGWYLVKHKENFTFTFTFTIYVGLCHHEMVHPQIVHGMYGL